MSAVLSDLLLEQGERRTFPGADVIIPPILRDGASNLNDDIHAILSDILDGRESDYDDDYQDERDLRQQLRHDENKILKALRELEEEEERDRRPVRFGDSFRDSNPGFSDDFATEGLRTDNSVPNLNNRGRFNPSRPPASDPVPDFSNRAPRQNNGDNIER